MDNMNMKPPCLRAFLHDSKIRMIVLTGLKSFSIRAMGSLSKVPIHRADVIRPRGRFMTFRGENPFHGIGINSKSIEHEVPPLSKTGLNFDFKAPQEFRFTAQLSAFLKGG
ncbi:MAG: hypothetical protein [Microviridae sp.]|nr:MAG: hypothetical protein [Microviridae sp.]